MLVYSASSRESLQSTSKWLSAVKAALPSGSSTISLLVGNKLDLRDGTLDSRAEVSAPLPLLMPLDDPGQVTSYEGSQFAAGLGLKHFETSAASNIAVEEPFRYIAEEFVRKYQQEVGH